MDPTSFNPIIPGFSPDPSICRIGRTFFLVTSSFHVFPGIPIYASQNLRAWTHIGNAINRPGQVALRKATTYLNNWEDGSVMLSTGGLFAPTIRHHNGRTYIVSTNAVHHGTVLEDGEHAENFIIWTDDIWSGKWSDPIYYDFDSIDPSLFFEGGKVYIQGSKTPEFQIYNLQIDVETGRILDGPKLIWEGWDRRFTEGPHVYKKDGWYYLLCAEGGTFEFHMTSMARSPSIWGPFEPSENNPIWTAYGTNNYIQHCGHSDLVQDGHGSWWIVMLGVRKRGDRYTMGRETFLSSVEWDDGAWPRVSPVTMAAERPQEHEGHHRIEAWAGLDWAYIREPDLDRFKVDGKRISVEAASPDLSSPLDSPSFIGKRQRLLDGAATVCLKDRASYEETRLKAGLALYKDEHRHAEIAWESTTGCVHLRGVNKARKFSIWKSETLSTTSKQLWLRISYTEVKYEFAFAELGEGPWTSLGSVDSLMMTGFDFIGPLIGLLVVGEGAEVDFEDFEVDV
ncbi:putative xylanase 35 [Xylariomycetidae sp. FL0641]|nr:putative xylanase 35 [Xylariomycetidae sp. FL0641]